MRYSSIILLILSVGISFLGFTHSDHVSESNLSGSYTSDGIILWLNPDGTFSLMAHLGGNSGYDRGAEIDVVIGTWQVGSNGSQITLIRDSIWFQVEDEWIDTLMKSGRINVYFLDNQGDTLPSIFLINEGNYAFSSQHYSTSTDWYLDPSVEYGTGPLPYYLHSDSGSYQFRFTERLRGEEEIDSLLIYGYYRDFQIDPLVLPKVIYPQCGSCNNFLVRVKDDVVIRFNLTKESTFTFDSLVMDYAEGKILPTQFIPDTLLGR